MSESKTSKEASADTPAECPICFEKFQPPKVSQRALSCGHVFCHDCLVKCMVASQDNGHIENCLICPVCRFVTVLYREESDSSTELPPLPPRLPYGAPQVTSNTLVIPGHFLMPLREHSTNHRVSSCPRVNSVGQPQNMERETHIFMITQHGMPMREENSAVVTQERNVVSMWTVVRKIFLAIVIIAGAVILIFAIHKLLNYLSEPHDKHF